MALAPGQSAETGGAIGREHRGGRSRGHKALVFSQWTSLLDHIEPRLKNAGLPFARLDGSTRNRPAVVASLVYRATKESAPPIDLPQ
jgi:SNF2 family DNA or RNA helicase